LVRKIHTRMPVILPEEQLDAWLSGEAGKEILNVSSSVRVLVPLLISAPSKVVAPVTAAE
jgi:putative SOS response-associated peptidase YedK